MTDLDEKEQENVRAALRYLRRQLGGWASVAKALRYEARSIGKILERAYPATPQLAFRVARLIGVGLDPLLDGTYVPGACPKCGHVPHPH